MQKVSLLIKVWWLKRQTRATYGCMAIGQSPWPWIWLQARLYAGFVCDDSAAEAAYAAIVALYKWTLRVLCTCYRTLIWINNIYQSKILAKYTCLVYVHWYRLIILLWRQLTLLIMVRYLHWSNRPILLSNFIGADVHFERKWCIVFSNVAFCYFRRSVNRWQ